MKLSKLYLAITLLAQISFAAPVVSFTSMANDSVELVWKNLTSRGLERWDAYHPLLPRPVVPAKFAVVNKQRKVLAYFNEEFGVGGSTYVFKAVDGGSRHSVSFGWNGIKFVTPYAGTVALSNQYMTVNGPGYDFLCHSQYVNFPYFKNCVTYNWISVIVRQLTRFN